MKPRTCYGCRYLCQSGDSTNGCLRFDYDGEFQGTTLRDDPPEPLYSDCFEPFAEAAAK